ncbi:hypothetical protein [Methylomagnum ishizawai]|uniref:hypothetical protein n=1 Tax=Methylomagnum ishizawai TaxID=1760988 RepID=UPI001C38F961|nr:hypothetical protein [Methylomagnum ishizawai]
MKLIELSSDKPSFKTLRFNPEGLTLIVGDGRRTVGRMAAVMGLARPWLWGWSIIVWGPMPTKN